MPKVGTGREDVRCEFAEAGRWGEFCRLRSQKILLDGMKPAEAHKAAVSEIRRRIAGLPEGTGDASQESAFVLPDGPPGAPAEVEEEEKSVQGSGPRRISVEDEPKPDPTEDPYYKLTVAAKGKKARGSRVRQWVLEHMEIPAEMVDPETVPDQGAPAVLRWAKANPNAFMPTVLPKAAEKQAEANDAESVADDDRRHDEILAEFSQRLAAAG